jgi:hypothetical protein
MNRTAQFDLHPDAEHLNAFAERALNENERDEVLRHLAACSRCRQVVGLAFEAAREQELQQVAAAAAAPAPVVEPIAWGKRLRLVWVPAAVAAAFAVTTFSVYLHHRNPAIRVAEQSQNVAGAPASTPPAEFAEAAPPAPAPPAAKSPTAVQSKATPNARQRSHQEPPIADRFSPLQQSLPAQPQLPPSPSAPADLAQGFPDEGSPGRQRPDTFNSSASVELQAQKKQQDLEKQQAQAGALYGSMFAASATPMAQSGSARKSAPPSAKGRALATTERSELHPAPAASFGAIGELKPGVLSAARITGSFHLPSGLPAISIASSADRRIALDQDGTLFVSEDAGKTWERVPRQWTGRAILVRRALGNQSEQESLAAQSAGNQPAAAQPQSSPVFEIVNDQGQVWFGSDGKSWMAK